MIKFVKTLFGLFTQKLKRKYIYLLILFIITAFVQVAGIASVAPFIALLSKPEIIHSNRFVHAIYTYSGSTSITSFYMLFATLSIFIIAFSNSVAGFAAWRLSKFSVEIGADVQNRIYHNYIHNDFVFFSNKNSARLVSIFTQDMHRFVFHVLQAFLHFISQFLVTIAIVSILIYVDPYLAFLSVLLVGGLYFYIFRLLRGRLEKHGKVLSSTNQERVKLLNESLGGIKEVKLQGTESWYEDKLRIKNDRSLSAYAFVTIFGDMPRFLVETVVLIGIFGLAIYLTQQYKNSVEAISILSLYALAGYKLLPSVQLIYRSLSSMKANAALVYTLHEEMQNSSPQVQPDIEQVELQVSEPSIRLSAVSYRYPQAESLALRDITLSIEPNSITAFVGASGAGKSTAVDIILGLLYPDRGQLSVNDQQITRANVRSWQKHIGYVPQHIFIFDDTIARNIAFGIPEQQFDMQRVIACAKMANIDKFIETLPGRYDYVVGERGAQLSGGQRQRIGIARALYRDTRLLVFDEATSALDSITESQIMTEIHNLAETRAVIIIAHRLSTVMNADKIAFFENGAVTGVGRFDELKRRNKNFAELVAHHFETSN